MLKTITLIDYLEHCLIKKEAVSKGRLSSRKIQYIVLRKCFVRIYSDKKGCPVTFGTPSLMRAPSEIDKPKFIQPMSRFCELK